MMVRRAIWFFIAASLIALLFAFGCSEPDMPETQDREYAKKLDLRGGWILTAWYPVNCPGCLDYHYDFTEGMMIFDDHAYSFTLKYTFHHSSDSIVERGDYAYSSYFFVAFFGASSMFSGEIKFIPDSGSPWAVYYRTGEEFHLYDQMKFLDFRMKNDSSQMVLYWEKEE